MPQAHGKLSKFVDIRDTAVATAGEEAARPVAQATTKQKRGESEQMIFRASQQAVSNVAAHC
ncbi:hypothetical protein F6X39_11070 [Paraburkholderia sp. UCT2]|nr:hypothetical protein [Paraburkholderia sp. UCT2]